MKILTLNNHHCCIHRKLPYVTVYEEAVKLFLLIYFPLITYKPHGFAIIKIIMRW